MLPDVKIFLHVNCKNSVDSERIVFLLKIKVQTKAKYK